MIFSMDSAAIRFTGDDDDDDDDDDDESLMMMLPGPRSTSSILLVVLSTLPRRAIKLAGGRQIEPSFLFTGNEFFVVPSISNIFRVARETLTSGNYL